MYYQPAVTTAIFWDYENVSLQHATYDHLLLGLSNFAKNNNVEFARVYA